MHFQDTGLEIKPLHIYRPFLFFLQQMRVANSTREKLEKFPFLANTWGFRFCKIGRSLSEEWNEALRGMHIYWQEETPRENILTRKETKPLGYLYLHIR